MKESKGIPYSMCFVSITSFLDITCNSSHRISFIEVTFVCKKDNDKIILKQINHAFYLEL